jgi:guanylate kinase
MGIIINDIKWEYSSKMIERINKLNYPILIIVGVSGSGKSYLANYLSQEYVDISIIRNFTTRHKRQTDDANYFEFVTDKEFSKLLDGDSFFIARYEKYPCYGYLNNDMEKIILSNKIPLFMFRHSGMEVITKLIPNCYTIVLNCNALKANEYSKNEIDVKSSEMTSASQGEILKLAKSCKNIYNLTNQYDNKFIEDIGLKLFINGMKPC